MKHYLLITLFIFCHSAFADDNEVITHVIKAQWETPNKPINIAPIVIEGNYAIAGWAQGERGGRALLRRKDTLWEVLMCGGNDMTKPEILEQSGMNSNEARNLASKLKDAEQGLSSSTRQQLSIFEGHIRVNHHTPH